MYETLLTIHIIAGIASIESPLHVLSPRLANLKYLFAPAVASVGLSGAGLLFNGASLTRVCVSGVAMMVAIAVIQSLVKKQATKQQSGI